MNEIGNIETDFRKWILFNNLLGDFQNLYDLYVSVDRKKIKGGVSFIEEESEGDIKFIIEQSGNDSTLELIGEENRKLFLTYLTQHYFSNQEVEEWYKSKLGIKEKSHNHLISEQPSNINHHSSIDEFKVHPKESKYYNLRLFISIAFYLLVVSLTVFVFLESVFQGTVVVMSLSAVLILIAITRRITQGFFIGLIKGNAVKIHKEQYPEIFKIVKDQVELIGLGELPEVYITSGRFNAFVTKFARKKYLMLYSELIETASRGDFEVLKFVVGHELGHLKRRHLNKEIWLTPSSFVPFIRLAHSRACEYTCDRIGYHFSSQGSIEGILILAIGKEIHSKINANRFIEDADSEKDFWVWLSEKFLSHPHISKRLAAIKNYDKRGY